MPSLAPRSAIGVPEPPASRPKLSGVRWLLAHEVGVRTTESGRYRSADPVRVLDDATAVAAYGANTARLWEYSFMLGRDGSIFTQAGEFVAAHCLGFNAESVGVLFLNALGLAPTQAQIDAWLWLRGELVRTGVLAADHAVAPHYRFRATSCPGVLAEPPGEPWPSPTGQGRTGELIGALRADPTFPPTPTPEDDEMAAIVRIKGWWNTWLIGTGPALHLTPELFAFYKGKGVPELVVADHAQLRKALFLQSGTNESDMVPSGGA